MPEKGHDRENDFGCVLILGMIVAVVAVPVLVALGVAVYNFTMDLFQDIIRPSVTGLDLTEAVSEIVAWVLLSLISMAAAWQVREIILSQRAAKQMMRAHLIAVIIGLVTVLFLFRQPFLDRLFGGHDASDLLKLLLFVGGVAGGWMAWYLRYIAKYGEFFHVLLMTIIVGFCWYAKLVAPAEVQLTAVALLLGSLFRIAKDYMNHRDHVDSEQRHSSSVTKSSPPPLGRNTANPDG